MLQNHRPVRFVAILFTLLVISASAYSQRFGASIDGAQETPPSGSAGLGYGNVVVSPDGTQITVNMGFTGLGTAATAAHIHTAAVGVPGPVTFGLSGVPGATSGVIPQQTFAISPAQLADLLAGNMYFNIHTGGFPGGEIRGQILPPSCTTASAVEVHATAGTMGPTGYTTLALATTAINAGTHQGAIDAEVCSNTTETVSATLVSGTIAPAAYTSVNVFPVGAARTVTGSIVGTIIKLNGADNVTVDGRIGGTGRNLTVSNSNTSAATAAIWLASVVAGNGASNNIIRNLEVAAGATANTTSNATFGIIQTGTTISLTSTDGNDNDNNQFIFNRVVRARHAISSRGVTTNNNISPIVTDNIVGPTSFGADEIGQSGIYMQADTGALVSRNTVQFVGGDLANTTAGADRCGICIGTNGWSATATTAITSGDYTVTRNTIHDVIEERTFSAIGIVLGTTRSGVATNNLVANNFIYTIRANGTGGDQVAGIGVAAGHTDSIVNNSISITGDQDPGAAGATTQYGNGIRIPGANGTNNVNFTVMNNSIYMDASSSSTAANRYYAITLNSAAYVFGTGGLNFNNYYINPANTQLQTGGLSTTTGSTTTTQFATLALWQAALTAPQDAASIQANPLHASPTADLHLTGASPNINVGTTIAAVTVDIDNEARPNGPAYDIGADEFYPSPGVLQLSSATYGGNEGTTLVATVNRVMGSSGIVGATYTMTDGSGTGGAACGVGVDYVNPGPTLLSFGDSVTSQPINVTLCTDAVTDPAETFTITLSLPTGGATLGSPTVATATITDIPPPFNGTYTVGTGGNYPSLTNTGGIFEAINLAGATGNVTIEILSNLSGELGTHPLNEIAGGYSTTMYPCSSPTTITGSNAGALIRLNGADLVTINGDSDACSPPAVVGGTAASRHLTIQNTNTSTSAVVISVGSNATNGAQNNTIQNVRVLGQDPLTSLLGISLGGATPGTVATGPNNNNRVENCLVGRALFGIYSAGLSAASPNTGTVITMNETSAVAGDRIRRVGILVFFENGVQITENSINGVSTNESADGIGIGVGTQGIDTTNTTSGGVINALVERNKINGVASLSTVGFSAAGITVAGGTGGANTIRNNMITGVTSPATSPDIVAGIYVVGATGSSTRLYHNSIAMTGDRFFAGASAAQMPGFGVAITGADPTVELKNNIFYTTQISSGGGVNAESYTIGMVTTTFVNLDSNYNDFFSSGVNAGFFRSGSLGSAAGTDYGTLAAWQTAVSDDANSQEVDPVFVNPVNDLHLEFNLTAPDTPLIGDGLTGFATVDHDNDPRPATAPEIGADELVQSATGVFPAGIFYNAIAAPDDQMAGSATITNSITLNGILNTGNFNSLTLECNAVFLNAGGGNYVVGTVNKQYCGTGAFTYPVGTTPDALFTEAPEGLPPEYTPVTVNVTAGEFPSFLSARVFDGTLIGFDPANSLSRNWQLEELGDLTADLSFTYLDGVITDVNGAEANYIVYRRNANGTTDPMCLIACADTINNILGPVTGVTQFSRWSGAALAPTAAGVDVAGRVLVAGGGGLRNAIVTLTDSRGVTRTSRSSSFGNYRFEDVRVGETYILAVNSKRYTFTPRTIQVLDEVTGLDIIADGDQ
ncbi:MAG: CHRD domain-containing protein [Pyrinomonadaceae bacterium]